MVILLNRIFYKTFISKSYYAAVGLILCGMVLLGGSDYATFDYRGLALGITSALTYAIYVILSKKSSLTPLASTFMVSIGCIATCLFAALLEGTFCIPQDFSVWLNIIAVGTLCTALPMLFLLKALHYISSEKASLLSVLEPVFVLIFGVILLDETVTLIQIIGIIIVLFGAIITLFGADKKKTSDQFL
jgi:drug/metabolite transporter (DMT)-like permease